MQKFLQSFSTIFILIYLSILLVFAAVCSNPLIQSIVYLSIVFEIFIIDKKKVKGAAAMSLIIGLPVVIINPLINDMGSTVILSIGDLLFIDSLEITLEAVIFAMSLALKLVTTVLIFSLFNMIVNPDRVINLVSAVAAKSSLVIALTAKTIPVLITQMKEIGEIQRTRGVNLDSKNIVQKIRGWYPFAKIILFSSLENSHEISEAIETKAYGKGKRTVFFNEKTRPRDLLLTVNSMLLLILLAIGISRKWFSYKFFPVLDGMATSFEQITAAFVIPILILFPVIIAWGCSQWRYLRLKI